MRTIKNPRVPSSLYKPTAYLLISCFLCAHLTQFPTTAYAQPLRGIAEGTDSHSLNASSVTPENLANLAIPSDLGRIDDRYIPKKAKRAVILLQDAHSIPDAQIALSKLIKNLTDRMGLELVGVEGISTEIKTELFRNYPDKAKLENFLNEHLSKGELSGAFAAALLSEKQADYVGLEKPEDFEKSMEAFFGALDQKETLTQRLVLAQNEIDGLKAKYYNEAFKKVDNAIRAYETTQTDFASSLKTLIELSSSQDSPGAGGIQAIAASLNEQTDKQAEQEVKKLIPIIAKAVRASKDKAAQNTFQKNVQAFQTSQLSALAFLNYAQSTPVKLSDAAQKLAEIYQKLNSLKGAEFAAEIETLTINMKARAQARYEEKEIDAIQNRLDLLGKAIRLELSYKDWARFEKQTKSANISSVNLEIAAAQKNLEAVESAIAAKNPIRRFYHYAVVRDHHFMEQLTDAMAQKKVSVAAMVAGGFHTEGMKALFREKNIAYVQVSPTIINLPEKNSYSDHMQGRVSWAKYFRIENGRIDLSDAFARLGVEKLLDKNQVKFWRDEILKDLSREQKLSEAQQFTKYLDEYVWENYSDAEKAGFKKSWQAKIDKLVSVLKGLEGRKNISADQLMRLYNKAGNVSPFTIPAQTLPGSWYRATDQKLASVLLPNVSDPPQSIQPVKIQIPPAADLKPEARFGAPVDFMASASAGFFGMAVRNETRSQKPDREILELLTNEFGFSDQIVSGDNRPRVLSLGVDSEFSPGKHNRFAENARSYDLFGGRHDSFHIETPYIGLDQAPALSDATLQARLWTLQATLAGYKSAEQPPVVAPYVFLSRGDIQIIRDLTDAAESSPQSDSIRKMREVAMKTFRRAKIEEPTEDQIREQIRRQMFNRAILGGWLDRFGKSKSKKQELKAFARKLLIDSYFAFRYTSEYGSVRELKLFLEALQEAQVKRKYKVVFTFVDPNREYETPEGVKKPLQRDLYQTLSSWKHNGKNAVFVDLRDISNPDGFKIPNPANIDPDSLIIINNPALPMQVFNQLSFLSDIAIGAGDISLSMGLAASRLDVGPVFLVNPHPHVIGVLQTQFKELMDKLPKQYEDIRGWFQNYLQLQGSGFAHDPAKVAATKTMLARLMEDPQLQKKFRYAFGSMVQEGNGFSFLAEVIKKLDAYPHLTPEIFAQDTSKENWPLPARHFRIPEPIKTVNLQPVIWLAEAETGWGDVMRAVQFADLFHSPIIHLDDTNVQNMKNTLNRLVRLLGADYHKYKFLYVDSDGRFHQLTITKTAAEKIAERRAESRSTKPGSLVVGPAGLQVESAGTPVRSESRTAGATASANKTTQESAQEKINRLFNWKETARARAASLEQMNRQLHSLFSALTQAKRGKNREAQLALESQIVEYRDVLLELSQKIKPDSDSPNPARDQEILDEISEEVDLKQKSQELQKQIKGFLPKLTEAFLKRDLAELEELNFVVSALIKARLKAQLLQTAKLLYTIKDWNGGTPILTLFMAVSGSYQKLSEEYAWRWRRAVVAAQTAKISVVDAQGRPIESIYDYGTFRIFSQEATDGKESIILRRHVWVRHDDGGPTAVYKPELREINFDDLETTLRAQLHTLISQQRDYANLLGHVSSLDFVKSLLETQKDNLTEYQIAQIETVIADVQHGPSGLARGKVTQKTEGSENLQAVIPAIRAGNIAGALGFVQGTINLIKNRLADIEKKKDGIEDQTAFIAHRLRNEETQRAAIEIRNLMDQKNYTAAQDLVTLVYQTHYVGIAGKLPDYLRLQNQLIALKNNLAVLSRNANDQNALKLARQALAQLSRSEAREGFDKSLDYAALKGLEHVKNSTVISLQMEMGYSAGFLKEVEGKFGKKIADQVSQATLTGGLGALMHDLFPSWKANGLDIIGIHPIWEEIKKKPYPEGPLNLGQYQRQVMEDEMAKRGESAVEFTIDLPWDDDYKRHADGNEKSKAAFGKRVYIRALKEYTSQYGAPNYHLDAYYLKDESRPDTEDNRHRVFDTVYSDDHNSWREYHMALYGRASEKLIKLLKEQGLIKENSVEIHNEVFVSVPKAEADPNRTLVHINHSAYLPTIYSPDVLSYGLLGFPQWMQQYIVKDGRSISLVDFAALNYDMLTGVAIDEHFWVLRRNIFRNAGGRLDHFNDGEIRSTNGVLTEHWQSLPLQSLIEYYRVKLGLSEKVDSAEFYKTLEAQNELREEFITRQEFIKAAEAANFLGWMADTQNQPTWLNDAIKESGKSRDDFKAFFSEIENASNFNDSAVWLNIEKKHGALRDILLSHPMVSNVRRQVPYKGPEKWIEVLRGLQSSPEKLTEFKKSKIRVIIGGRTFSNQADDEFRQMAKIVKELGLENHFAFIEDYNVYDAAIMFRAMAGVVMLSDEFLEASATSMMKGVVNGAALIGVWGGAMPELFKILDENGQVVDIFKKKTPHNLVVRNLRSKKWKLVNGYMVRYSNEKSHQAGGGRRPEAEALASSLLWLHEQYAETTKRRELLWHSVSGTPKVDMREGQARAHMQLIERLLREKARVQTDIFEKLSFNPEDFQEILKEDAEKFVWRRNENELFKTGDNSPPGLFGLVNMFREISTYGSGDERGKAAIEAIQYHSLRGNILNNRVNNPDSYILYEIRNLPPSFQPFTDEIKKLAAETGPIIELLRRIKEDPEMEGEYIAGLNRLTNLNISALELIEKLGLWIARQAFETYINQRDPKAAEMFHKNIFSNHFIKKYLSRYLDRHAEAVPMPTKHSLIKSYGIVNQGKPYIFGINLGAGTTFGSGKPQHKAYTDIPHSASLRQFAAKFSPDFGKALEKHGGAVYQAINAITGEKYSFYDLAKRTSVISLGLPDPEGIQLIELEHQKGPATNFLVATRVEDFDTEILENFLKDLKHLTRANDGKISQEAVDEQMKQIAGLNAEIAKARFGKYLTRVMGLIAVLSPKYLDSIKDWDPMFYAALKKNFAENRNLFENGNINFHSTTRQQTVLISRSIDGENGQNIFFAIEFSEAPVNMEDGKIGGPSRVLELAPLKLNPTHEYDVINLLSGIAYQGVRTGTELMDEWSVRVPVRDFYERGEKIRHGWGVDIYRIRSVTPRFDLQSQAQVSESQNITIPDLMLGISVLDVGAVYDNATATVSSSGALEKLSELIPVIENAGFGTVYPYGGLNSSGTISKGLHAVDTTSIHWVGDTTDGTLPRVLVSVSGYETKKRGNLRDNHGNPFSPLDLIEIDPRHSSAEGQQGSPGRSEQLLTDLSDRLAKRSIRRIVDFIHWRAPESVTDQNYRQYFYRELSSDDIEEWKEADSDAERLKIMKNLTRSGGHFVVRIHENETERPILVQHMYNEPGRDQTVRNPFHPDVIAKSKKEIEESIKRGAKGMRIDLAHKLLNAELKTMMDEWLKAGWQTDPAGAYRADYEPLQDLINYAKSIKPDFYVIAEAYMPYHHDQLRKLGVDAVYYENLHKDYVKLASGNAGINARNLADAIENSFKNKDLFVFPSNYDISPLKNARGSREAFLLIMVILAKMGVPVMLDARELMDQYGQLIPIPGRDHPWPTDPEIQKRRDFEHFRWQFEQSPFVHMMRRFLNLINGRKLTGIKILDNQNRDQFISLDLEFEVMERGQTKKDHLLVVLNMKPYNDAVIWSDSPFVAASGEVQDIATGETFKRDGGKVQGVIFPVNIQYRILATAPVRSELRTAATNDIQNWTERFAAAGGDLTFGLAGALAQVINQSEVGPVTSELVAAAGEVPLARYAAAAARQRNREAQTASIKIEQTPEYNRIRQVAFSKELNQLTNLANLTEKSNVAFGFTMDGETPESVISEVLQVIEEVKTMKRETNEKANGNIRILMPENLKVKFSELVSVVEKSGVAKMIWTGVAGDQFAIEKYLTENPNAVIYGRIESLKDSEEFGHQYVESEVGAEWTWPVALRVTNKLAVMPNANAVQLKKAIPDAMPGAITSSGKSFTILSTSIEQIFAAMQAVATSA